MKTYTVKEIFYTLQGEGSQAGRPSVFCRFAGCNLWSGHEKDRANAVCQFCDTDFVKVGPEGGKFKGAAALAECIAKKWPAGNCGVPYVVCTGGEPLLQVDVELITELHRLGFKVAVETNGTIAAPPGLDWICVSPKAGANLVQRSGNELKLVYPQSSQMPSNFEQLEFETFYLQPMDGPELSANTRAAIAYCMEHPHWRLSVQIHKVINIR